MELNLDEPVRDLSVREQQWIEILKALYIGVDLLILDEPTAVLTPQETEKLFSIIRKMADNGISIMIITHKLQEVIDISKRVTILRRGKLISTILTKDTSKKELANKMVGRDINLSVKRKKTHTGNVLFEMKDVYTYNNFGIFDIEKINLSLHTNEILGIAGVGGNGQQALFDVIVGVNNVQRGKIFLENSDITDMDSRERMNHGIASIPPDRINQGLLLEFTVAENLILGIHRQKRYRSGILFDFSKINDYSSNLIKDYEIQTPDAYQKTGLLSGGNLQKVILARELSQNIKVVIANSPTRGLDVGATEYVHTRLLELRNNGVGILLISEDLDEIINLSDKVAVIYKGKIRKEFISKEVEKEKIGLIMGGVA